MFNKDNNIKIVNMISGKLYQDENIMMSSSLVGMVSEHHVNKETLEKEEYQDKVTSYINKKHELGIKKQYNPVVVNLYRNGLLIIDNEEYPLKDFYIVFDDNINNFHLKSKYDKFNKEENYNKAIKFIDTTAFISLINSNKVNIKDNKLILNNIEILNNIISQWDGYLHSEMEETDAISNKKMIKDDVNE